jgi:hypothetical protein
MPDIDSPLDTRLQSFFEDIKRQGLPSQLADFKPATAGAGQRMLNLFAGAAAIAFVAAGVALFAVELNGHHTTGSPISIGQSAATPTPKTTPPFLAEGSAPAGATVLIPVTHGSGSETLPAVMQAPDSPLSVEYACVSAHTPPPKPDSTANPGGSQTGNFTLLAEGGSLNGAGVSHGSLSLDQCSNTKGEGTGLRTAGGYAGGGPVTFSVNADPSVKWVILVYEAPLVAATPATSITPEPTPPTLGEWPASAGATVLVPVTYGTGAMTLPTITETATDQIYVELGCLSTSPSVTTLTMNEYDPAFFGDTIAGSCFGARGGGIGSSYVSNGGMVTMKIQAAPTEKWVILVYEGPFGEFGP